MNEKFGLRYVVGLLAIVVGAVATFDYTLLPALRYLAIYLSIFVIVGVMLLDVYQFVDDTPTYDKIKEEQ